MKKIALPLFLLFSLAASAQMKEGKVVYERTLQMQNRFQGMNEETARQLPLAAPIISSCYLAITSPSGSGYQM